MRGPDRGALDRVYLHSPVTVSLWYDVAEAERLFTASLTHAVMRASLYGNPETSVDDGNRSIPNIFRAALKTIPYLKLDDASARGGLDELVEEWRKANAALSSNGGEASGV